MGYCEPWWILGWVVLFGVADTGAGVRRYCDRLQLPQGCRQNAGSLAVSETGAVDLEAEVAECLVGFGHAVHFVTLLHGATTAFGGLQQLIGQALAIDFSPRLRAAS